MMNLKRFIPYCLKNKLKKVKVFYFISRSKAWQRTKTIEIKRKNKIKVAFFIFNEAIWKNEELYFLMKKDPRFEPVVFVCPFITYGNQLMRKEMDAIYNKFKDKGYNVIKTLKSDNTFMDVKAEYSPDLVFFSTPWNHTIKKYQVYNFLNTLTCYVPYAFMTSNLNQSHYNKDTHNLVWKYFLPTEVHKKLAKKHSIRNGKNVLVLGFPGMDKFLNQKSIGESVWKKQSNNRKRIIWAPHHTIPGTKNALNYSTFLKYADFMLELTEKYKESIQFAFKPHPNLRGKLNDVWGRERTDTYYNTWSTLENGQLEEGEYIALFSSSDALIHDSGSFVIEYLYTNKPVMFLMNSEKVKEEFNDIGKKALSVTDQGYKKEDILQFIEESVLKGKDKRKDKRMKFFNKIVKPPQNKTASENIYHYLKEELKNV